MKVFLWDEIVNKERLLIPGILIIWYYESFRNENPNYSSQYFFQKFSTFANANSINERYIVGLKFSSTIINKMEKDMI